MATPPNAQSFGDGCCGGVKRHHISGPNDDEFDALPEGGVLRQSDGLGIAVAKWLPKERRLRLRLGVICFASLPA